MKRLFLKLEESMLNATFISGMENLTSVTAHGLQHQERRSFLKVKE